jgi:hypothetical protein
VLSYLFFASHTFFLMIVHAHLILEKLLSWAFLMISKLTLYNVLFSPKDSSIVCSVYDKQPMYADQSRQIFQRRYLSQRPKAAESWPYTASCPAKLEDSGRADVTVPKTCPDRLYHLSMIMSIQLLLSCELLSILSPGVPMLLQLVSLRTVLYNETCIVYTAIGLSD